MVVDTQSLISDLRNSGTSTLNRYQRKAMIANRLWVGCGWVWGGNRWDWVQCGRGACKEFNEFIKRHYDPKLSDLSKHSVVL